MTYSILGYNHPYGYYAGTSAYKFFNPPAAATTAANNPAACGTDSCSTPPSTKEGSCSTSGSGGSCAAPPPSSTSASAPSAAPATTKGGWTKDPKLWGPHLWAYLHYSASNYPEKPTESEIQEMMSWLSCLPVTIPCSDCSRHYKNYIEQNRSNLPAICSTKDNLFKFLVDIHNKVNERYGKPRMSYEEAWKLYL